MKLRLGEARCKENKSGSSLFIFFVYPSPDTNRINSRGRLGESLRRFEYEAFANLFLFS